MVPVWEELKRRNGVRVAIAYLIFSWLSLQVTDELVDLLTLPDWIGRLVFLLLLIGFPLALFFAWAYELTPDGLKNEKEIDRSHSITQQTGRRLDRIIIIVLAVSVAFLLVDKFVLPDSKSIEHAAPTIAAITDKSVAVLPFVAMSDGSDDEFFADGLTEEILNSLSQLPELLVIARTSAFAFKCQDRPIPEIADELGVAYVVEGSVRFSEGDLRITAQLVRASDGFQLWSDTYNRSREDSLTVQIEIAEKVAAALGVVLSEEQQARMRSVGLRRTLVVANSSAKDRFPKSCAGLLAKERGVQST